MLLALDDMNFHAAASALELCFAWQVLWDVFCVAGAASMTLRQAMPNSRQVLTLGLVPDELRFAMDCRNDSTLHDFPRILTGHTARFPLIEWMPDDLPAIEH